MNMSPSVRLASLVVTMGLASLTARSLGQTESNAQGQAHGSQTPAKSVARFAIDDFMAGCRVRPKLLIADPHFGSLPIHRHLPDGVTLGRLDALGVEEIAVFCGPGTGGKTDVGQQSAIEWAAAARLSKPIQLEALMRRWRQSLVSQEESGELNAEPIQLEGHDCFRVPAGSFLPPPRIYGKLRFTDREGQPADQGISVGNLYEYRSYVEGNSKASAIFTLEGIDEADLVDGVLPLELRLDVFRTYNSGREFSVAQVELHNPDTGLRSEPVRFEAKSYVDHRLSFPRRLTAIDAKGKRQADLLEDFVSGGRLDIVLTGTERAIYIGVGAFDLAVRPRAFEYVYVSNWEIVVAQSQATIARMLRAPASSVALAERLSREGEVVVAADVRQNEDRKTFQQLSRLISDGEISRHWADTLTEITGVVDLDQAAAAQITATFNSPRDARRAGTLCRASIRRWRTEAHEIIDESIDRAEVGANLATIGMDGISFAFPRETTEEYEVEHEKRKAELLKIIDSAWDGVQAESAGEVLTIQFSRPSRLVNLSKPANYAWAKMDEALGRFLYNFEEFDHADEVLRRVTSRCPEEPGAWFRRAWHLSFNLSVEFDGYETRYAWVRRGINALLDGAEQNPGTTDMLWMAARFIRQKVGESDERAAYRELFSNDRELHARLANYIDLDEAKSPGGRIDNFLVAKLLFEYCIEQHSNGKASSSIAPLMFLSRPAAVQARYADFLGQRGKWDEARQAWRETERLLDEFAARTIDLGDGIRIKLNALETRRARLGPTDPFVKILERLRKSIRYDFWRMRCRFEQTDEVQSARKLKFEADQHAKRSEWKKAIRQYRASLQILAELWTWHPKEMPLLAGDFADIASGYRTAQRRSGRDDEDALSPILKLIENSHSYSTFPLTLDPEDSRFKLDRWTD